MVIPAAAPPSRYSGHPAYRLGEQVPAVLPLAMVLTGRPDTAVDLVATALGGARRASSDTLLREIVVREYLQRRRWRPARGPGLDALRPTTRVAVALREVDGLPLAEVAAVMDRSPAAVAAELSAGLRALTGPVLHDDDGVAGPGPIGRDRDALRGGDVPGLADLLARVPETDRVHRRVAELGRQRDRRRARMGLAVIAIGLAASLAMALPMLVARLLPVPTRGSGEWVMIHRIEPPAGWRLLERSVGPDWEASTLLPIDNESERPGCRVEVHRPGTFDLATLPVDRQSARVNGRRGFFAISPSGTAEPTLAWAYTDDGWATITCHTGSRLDRAVLVEVARAVRFRRTELAVPFGLSTLPAGYHVASVTENLASPSAEIILAVQELKPGDAELSLTFTPMDSPSQAGFSRTLQLPSGVGYLDRTPGNPRLCLPQQDRYVCVAGYWPLGDWPARAPLPVNLTPVLIDTSQALYVADDLVDRESWFSAQEALP